MSLPSILPEHAIDDTPSREDGWIVTVFNNDDNTFDEVMMILMAATGCHVEEAYMETWEVDHLGKSVVHCGRSSECEVVAAIIATIGIRVEVSED